MDEDEGQEESGARSVGRSVPKSCRQIVGAKSLKKAAIARWGAKATHMGSFKEDFGIDVDCYVLDNKRKTAVISQRGIGEAIGGLGASGGHQLAIS